MKTEIYTWRLSSEIKSALETEARREGTTVAALLDQLARRWIEDRRAQSTSDSAEQLRLHSQAEKSIGKIASGKAHRAESARVLVRKRLHDRRLSR